LAADGKQHPALKLASADSFPIAYYAGGAKMPLALPAATAAGGERRADVSDVSDVARVRYLIITVGASPRSGRS
jgi:hypothetical protein